MPLQTEFEQQPTACGRSWSQPQSGQAIVLIVFVMVGLLGMLGLAIDGGGLFFLNRDAQNATDAAVVAASYAICTSGDPVQAGLAAAKQNGFDNDGSTNTVTVNYPPTSGAGAGNSSYVEVILTANKPAYFIQLVYRHPLEVSVKAVGYCIPRFDPSSVPGLWAGSTVCNNTVNWQGSNAYIEGGMYSNNEVYISQGTVKGEVEAVYSVGDLDKVTWDPGQPTIGNPVMPDPMNLDITLFAPGGEIARNVPLYKHITSSADDKDFNDANDTWQPKNGRNLQGLYYVEGNVNLGTGNDFIGKGATIVATGSIDLNAGSNKTVKYYEDIMKTTESGVQYPGILLFSNLNIPCDVANTNAIVFSGSTLTARGILYAPHGNINVKGSSITMYGSVIADMIDYSSSDSKLIYDPSLLPPRPPRINVAE